MHTKNKKPYTYFTNEIEHVYEDRLSKVEIAFMALGVIALILFILESTGVVTSVFNHLDIWAG